MKQDDNHNNNHYQGRHSAWFQGFLPIDKPRIPAEIIAGITLASIAIPEVMGYTKISGTPVITGLYTILIPALIYCLFCSSRHLVVGADSATAAILASALAAMSITNPDHYMALACVLALMTAILLILARFLNLGFLANFLSRSVLVGFLTGVGIQVAMGEFPGLFGVEGHGHGAVDKLTHFFTNLGDISILETLFCFSILVVIFYAPKLSKKLPGPLCAVILAIAVSWLFDFKALGMRVLGPLPSGLPEIGFPDIDWSMPLILNLVPVAISMFVVIIAQSAATSRAYAERYNENYNADKDILALAFANIGAAFSGTFVVNGSPTKTEILDSAGGRSQLSQLAGVATVLLVLLLFTWPLQFLPQGVLSVLVFLIGLKLIDIKGMTRIYRQARNEFWVAALTAATVVLVNVKEGILLALVLSLLDHVRGSYRPQSYVMVPSEKESWSLQPAISGAAYTPGLVVYHFTHGLYYANIQAFTDDLSKIMASQTSSIKWLCLDASAISSVDYSAALAIETAIDRLNANDIKLAIARPSPYLLQLMKKYDLIEKIGPKMIFKTRHDVLEAYQVAHP